MSFFLNFGFAIIKKVQLEPASEMLLSNGVEYFGTKLIIEQAQSAEIYNSNVFQPTWKKDKKPQKYESE